MVQTKQWLFNKKPTDFPHLEGPDATFKLVTTELPEPKDDEVLVKTIYLSNDPAQRTWISATADPGRLYMPPPQEGTPMSAFSLCQVVESKSANWKKDDWVNAPSGWSEYAVLPASSLQPAPELPNGLPRTLYLGSLGFPGLTAYFGVTEVAHVTKDDIVVVSGAAGATGNVAVQVCKNIIGCKKVIGIAGSDEKCRWVESLGADLCLNYKSPSFKEDLAKATPGPDGYADVYYDNVGGEILDFMLTRMARNGRVAACGAISEYNNSPERTTGLKNWFEIISMRIQIKGFIVLDYLHKTEEAIESFRKSLAEGKLKVDKSEHIVKSSFEDVPKTWLQLFSGANTGKLVTALV
ncbi:NAD(P)-binding protein [Teratosphaeria nubilosa]|uniref:NAD(P)-binding protein n=1 Tax=Teratosphaeria nubilosa TaxID=161662 RepID=A0A6G1LAL0_9PEZI|nr:NAD(P)-binding protein [Teratosphaeria nubilosa]